MCLFKVIHTDHYLHQPMRNFLLLYLLLLFCEHCCVDIESHKINLFCSVLLKQGTKSFQIDVGGREEAISVDRLKPAFVHTTGPPRRFQETRKTTKIYYFFVEMHFFVFVLFIRSCLFFSARIGQSCVAMLLFVALVTRYSITCSR